MFQAIARFIPTRQLVCVVTAASMFALTGCIDKNYVPPPKERMNPYSGETVSAPYDRASSSAAANAAIPAVSGTVKVGLLLPKTGRHSDLGRSLEHAATLAVFDKYAGMAPSKMQTRVELVTFDTGDTEEEARSAAEQAVAAQVAMIIGPVFGDTVSAVAAIAKPAGIPVVTFSNNKAVASAGVYIFGFSPEQQTSRVITYTLLGGKVRLAALTPKTPYGDTVFAAMQSAMRAQDIPLVTSAKYSAQGAGLEDAMETIIPKGKPLTFEAIFLPEAGPALDTILRTLDGRAGERIGLIGTGLWDDYTLINRVNLQGAWLASSPPMLTRAFEKRFSATYRYQPPRIASLAYDAASLAVTLATSGRGFDQNVLTHPGGFSGPANGIFRFHKNGTSERGLAVIMVQGGGYVVLDPAPTSFNVTPQ